MAFWSGGAVALRIDTGVVNDRIHAPDRVHLIRNALRLGAAAEIADRNSLGARGEISDRCGTIDRARVQHHAMALIKQGLCRCPAKPVRAAGDEDRCHAVLLRGFTYAMKS